MVSKVQLHITGLTLLAICFVITTFQGTHAEILQLSNVPLADFFSKIDISQASTQLGQKNSILDWIKWILKISSAFLDPLYIGHMKIDVEEKDVTAHVAADAMSIRHLLLSTISNVNVEQNELGVSANITFPKLALNGVYNLSGRIDELEMDLFGRGLMEVKLTDFHLYGALRLYIGTKLELKLEDLDYSLKGVDVFLDNLLGGEAVSTLINGIISDVAPIAAEDFKANVTQAIMDKVNKALANYVPQK